MLFVQVMAGQQFNQEDNMETPLITSTETGMSMSTDLEQRVIKVTDCS